MYVYAGNDRRNATLIVETNGSVPIGAPARVPISSGAIVVLQINSGSTSGNAVFSYKVSGVKYNWYEAPFIGKAYWVYILFLIALALGFAIVVCCPVFCICCCACICQSFKKRQTANRIKSKMGESPKKDNKGGFGDDMTDAGFGG
jgi:hypothetical protein